MPAKKLSEANLLSAEFSDKIILQGDGISTTPSLEERAADGTGFRIYCHLTSAFGLQFGVRSGGAWGSNKFSMSPEGNFTIGGAANVGANAAGVLAIVNGTAPTTSNGGVQVYSTAGEAKVRDQFGNVTTISPHHFDQIVLEPDDEYPVVIHHQNDYLGKEETIYLSKMARLVEALTGERLVWSRNLTAPERRDFQADELDAVSRRNAEIQSHRDAVVRINQLPEDERQAALESLPPEPPRYTARPTPAWIQSRING